MTHRKHHSHSPLSRRIVLFWLPLFAIFAGMAYLSQARYDPAKETRDALDRLNHWRTQAGVQTLLRQPNLETAAHNHAQYLEKDAHGHDEPNRSNPHYTGATPQERATAAGYSAPVAENLTISNFARSGSRSVDGLMTALYHRLALLTPNHDEAGTAWVRGKNNALVIEQGDSSERKLCDSPPQKNSGTRYLLTLSCNGQKTEIPLADTLPQYPDPVKFPIGSGNEPAYDGKEQPNPMPDTHTVGNPVSIAFYGRSGKIQMQDFTLRSAEGETAHPILLTAENDPNHLLQDNEFALFAPKPLKFDTEYTATFVYRQNGETHTETWTFRTRKRRNWLER